MATPEALLLTGTYTVPTGGLPTGGSNSEPYAKIVLGKDGFTQAGGLPVDVKGVTLTIINNTTANMDPFNTNLQLQGGASSAAAYLDYYPLQVEPTNAGGVSVSTCVFSSGVLPFPVLYVYFYAQPTVGDTFTWIAQFHGAASPLPASNYPDMSPVSAGYAYFDGATTAVVYPNWLPNGGETPGQAGFAPDVKTATLWVENNLAAGNNLTSVVLTFEDSNTTNTLTYTIANVDVAPGGTARYRIVLDKGTAAGTFSITFGTPTALNAGTIGFALSLSASGSPEAIIAGAVPSAATTMQNAAAATGKGTGLDTANFGVAVVDLQISATATVTWQGVGSGGNTYDLNAVQVGGSGAAPTMTPSNTATASGLYRVNCAGASTVYANVTSWTSGTVTATGQAQPLTAADAVSITGSSAPLPYLEENPVHNTTTTIAAGASYSSATYNTKGYRNAYAGINGAAGTSLSFKVACNTETADNAYIAAFGVATTAALSSPYTVWSPVQTPVGPLTFGQVYNENVTDSMTFTEMEVIAL